MQHTAPGKVLYIVFLFRSFVQFSRYIATLPFFVLFLIAKKEVVGSNGLEPSTSRLSGARSNHLSYEPTDGGDEEDRTPDPLLAKQVLSQLSYTPIH